MVLIFGFNFSNYVASQYDKISDDEASLIDFCYADHERVKTSLTTVLYIAIDNVESAHSFFQMVFSNQPLFNFLSVSINNPKREIQNRDLLFSLLTNSDFISSIMGQLIDPLTWFEQLTSKKDGKQRLLDSTKLTQLSKNISCLKPILDAISSRALLISDPNTILDLLFYKHTKVLFEIDKYRALYLTGEIDNRFLFNIPRPDLAKNQEEKSAEQGITFFKGTSSPTSVSSIASPVPFLVKNG